MLFCGSGITSNILQSKRSLEVDCQLWNSTETSKTEKICPENYCSREIWWLSPWSWIWCGCCGTCLCYWVHKWHTQCLPSWSISHFPRQHFLFCHWLGSFGEWRWVSLASLCPAHMCLTRLMLGFWFFCLFWVPWTWCLIGACPNEIPFDLVCCFFFWLGQWIGNDGKTLKVSLTEFKSSFS